MTNADQTAAVPPKHQDASKRQDARDLLALLYREIGISAVAAALQVDVEIARRVAAMPKTQPLPLPGVLAGNDIAA